MFAIMKTLYDHISTRLLEYLRVMHKHNAETLCGRQCE